MILSALGEDCVMLVMVVLMVVLMMVLMMVMVVLIPDRTCSLMRSLRCSLGRGTIDGKQQSSGNGTVALAMPATMS